MNRYGESLAAGRRSFIGRYTFYYHSRAIAFEGAFTGIFLLNDIVARKAFAASDFWVMLIVMIPGVSLLFSVYFSTLVPRGRKRAVFLWSGIMGRLILIGAAWVFNAPSFALLIALSSLSFPVLLPVQNAVYQANYVASERGRLFGAGSAISAVTTMAAALAAGWLLDHRESAYRLVYPAAGAIGFLACWLFYRIRWRRGFASEDAPPSSGQERFFHLLSPKILWMPFRQSLAILKANPSFAAYEGAYFAYGAGFMITSTLLPFYLVDEIGVSYEQAAHMKGIIYYALLVGLSSAFGRLCDTRNPIYVSRMAFTMLAFFPLSLYLSHALASVYAAFFLFGAAMAAVNIGWNMGPIFFSKERDSSAMMGVHVTLTGVRALLAHPCAILLKNAFDSARSPMLVASGLFVAAAFMMRRLEHRHR
jgi:MFS family permease